MTLPFLIIYLHDARGISLGVAGAAVATVALAGFAGNPVGGSLADRIGAKATVIGGLVVAGVGSVALTAVHVAWQAFPASALVGFGLAIVWPAQDALLAVLVRPAQRPAVFSIRHGTMNAGLAVGGLAAAVIVRDTSASRFVLLFILDGLTFFAFIPVLLLLGPVTTSAAGDGADADAGPRVGIGAVLRDPVFRRVWVLTALFVAVGYGQFNSTFPAFAARPGGIHAGAIGLVFAANTLAVVGLQLVTLRVMRGRRRTTAMALTCMCWAGAWALTVVAGAVGAGGWAVALFAAAAVVFALGETFLTPSLVPIVNDLAPDDLRGRYNGLSVLAWTTGFAVGPIVGGVALGAGLEGGFFAVVAGCCIALALASVGLARHLPEGANLIADEEEDDPAVAVAVDAVDAVDVVAQP
jgi:MFS family permease